jgi:hypothetical protein
VVKVSCSIWRLGSTYANGLDRIEMGVYDSEEPLTQPPAGTRTPVTLVVGGHSYAAGLRTYPTTGHSYICPDLRDNQDHARTSLAKAFADHGVGLADVTLEVDGDTWTVVSSTQKTDEPPSQSPEGVG